MFFRRTNFQADLGGAGPLSAHSSSTKSYEHRRHAGGIMHYVKGFLTLSCAQKLRAFLFHHGGYGAVGIGKRSPRCGAGDMISFLPRRNIVCEPPRRRWFYFEFRRPTVRHDDAGGDAGRPSLGSRGRRSLGSNVKPRLRPRRNSCLLYRYEQASTEEAAVGECDEVLKPGSVAAPRMWWRHCAG